MDLFSNLCISLVSSEGRDNDCSFTCTLSDLNHSYYKGLEHYLKCNKLHVLSGIGMILNHTQGTLLGGQHQAGGDMDEMGGTGVENTSHLGLLIYEIGRENGAQVTRQRGGLSGDGTWRLRHLAGNKCLIIKCIAFRMTMEVGICYFYCHESSGFQTTLKGPLVPNSEPGCLFP